MRKLAKTDSGEILMEEFLKPMRISPYRPSKDTEIRQTRISQSFSLPIFLLLTVALQAQPPAGYYSAAEGLTGYELKTALSTIITSGHTAQSYTALWLGFKTTDRDYYYENDGTILDIYSENPDGEDPYNYTLITDQCGNYSGEGSCYNREHLMPQSWFNEQLPMKSDIQAIYPTDGYVNGQRGHLPFGEVFSANYVSYNGSKRGNNVFDHPRAYTGEVFEPIDEFKGDIARVYFYMATRYESQIGSWENVNVGSQNTLDGTSDQVFDDWMLAMLLEWHTDDPVSQKEIDRNNAAFEFQGNRNPFIDHPEYASLIWNPDPNPDPNTWLIFEDFNDCSKVADNFVAVSELSAINWTCIIQYGENNSGAMQMNAYDNGQVPSLDWLITSRKIDFDDWKDEKLSFYTASSFGSTRLELLYSSDYDGGSSPSSFAWQPVPNLEIPLHTGESTRTLLFSDIDVSAITGQVYLAFKYDTSTGQEATRWTIDSFRISGQVPTGIINNRGIKARIYPNPNASRQLWVDIENGTTFHYLIYDLSQRVVKMGQNGTLESISLDGIPPGTYIVQISSGGVVAAEKLIILP